MSTNYVYSIVLLIVLSAWFGHSTIKLPAPQKTLEDETQVVISKIMEDMSMFGVELGNWSAGGRCNIELINGTPLDSNVLFVTKDNLLILEGWALDTENPRLPEKVIVRFSGAGNIDFFAISQVGLMREDVREHFKLPVQAAASGFKLATNILVIPVGQYAVTLIIHFTEKSYVCDNGLKINVK